MPELWGEVMPPKDWEGWSADDSRRYAELSRLADHVRDVRLLLDWGLIFNELRDTDPELVERVVAWLESQSVLID